MLGIFDSGVGGLTALREIKRISPETDVCFLQDRQNAPYGTKTELEIVSLVKKNIKTLLDFGAKKVLMACCTASTVYESLTEIERKIAVPIIDFAAEASVKISKNARIGVIATERTVKSRAFTKSIKKLAPKAEVFELATQSFVALVEGGGRDFNLDENQRRIIENSLTPLKNKNIDSLILGCTHFPHIRWEIERVIGVETVNPSEICAKEILKSNVFSRNGRCIYL